MRAGGPHRAENAEADLIRDAALTALGWRVVRFWNDGVLRDLENVCRHIIIVSGNASPMAEELCA